MKIIGITGGIGSGKSTVVNLMVKNFNAYSILTDDVARELMKKDNISYNLVVSYFGDNILNVDKEINREKLGKIVFDNQEKLEKLNSFTHPYVLEEVLNRIEKIKNDNVLGKDEIKIILIEAAILIEAGYEKICDEIWFISTDEKLRRKWLKRDRGYSEEKIDAVIKNQLKEELYLKHCNKILSNNGCIEDITQKIEKILV